MTNKLLKGMACAAALMVLPLSVAAQDSPHLMINEEIDMVTETTAPAHVEGLSTVFSGWTFRSVETQAMQMDDFDNPGMIFVDTGRDIWNAVQGSEGKSCASCHDAPEDSMVGVKPVYPRWNEEAGEVLTLTMQVNDCRENQMGAEAWKYDNANMLAVEALIASVSRGMPVNVAIDGPAQSTWERGQELYYTRFGQLDLSCASCHEQNYGNYIRADHLSQGQINGFPVYRLKNSRLNGTHSRFAGCIRDTRAETFGKGSDEFVALELYVASRGNGLSVEGPSVRN